MQNHKIHNKRNFQKNWSILENNIVGFPFLEGYEQTVISIFECFYRILCPKIHHIRFSNNWALFIWVLIGGQEYQKNTKKSGFWVTRFMGSNFNIDKGGHITHHFEAFFLLIHVGTILKL